MGIKNKLLIVNLVHLNDFTKNTNSAMNKTDFLNGH